MLEPGSRAIVSDDGSTIWLTGFAANGEAVPVAIEPVRAVALAGELIEAAVPKLNIAAKFAVTRPAPEQIKRRGGDPRAEQRRELHEGLCRLASLLGLDHGKTAAEVAREITARCNRYQPMAAVETDPVRREMLRVRNVGLPLPTSERHLARIISGRTSNGRAKNPIGCPTAAPIIR